MKIHDIGTRNDGGYPPAKEAAWSTDYGTRDFVERDRPYIDDEPAHPYGWEERNRWGSRPVREPERDLERGGVTVTGFINFAWRRIRNAAWNGV